MPVATSLFFLIGIFTVAFMVYYGISVYLESGRAPKCRPSFEQKPHRQTVDVKLTEYEESVNSVFKDWDEAFHEYNASQYPRDKHGRFVKLDRKIRVDDNCTVDLSKMSLQEIEERVDNIESASNSLRAQAVENMKVLLKLKS